MTGFQRLCLATCFVVFGLIVLGGVVRATESGLGCPDWPRCHGSFIPAWEKHTWIEYSHRLAGSAAGLMIFAIAFSAWRSFRNQRAIFVPAMTLVGLVLFQGLLGGITVLNELPAEVSALHLGTALLLFALLIVLTTTAFAIDRPLPRLRVSRGFARMAALATGGTLVLMLLGSYIAGAGYGLACGGWPLCNGQVVPDANALSVQFNFAHRLLALVLGFVMIGLMVYAVRERSAAPLAFLLSAAATGVFVAQVMVGAANAWTSLAELARASHLAVGTVLWVILVVLSIRVFGLHEALKADEPRPMPSKRDLARAAG
jgi:heme a synthase